MELERSSVDGAGFEFCMNKGIFLCHDFVLGFCIFGGGGTCIWDFFVCFVGVWDILGFGGFYVCLFLLLNSDVLV